MRTTGIVRRIDELGRVVIPKELRRTMRIREGEEVEVIAREDNTLVLKKYSAINQSMAMAQELSASIFKVNGYGVVFTDKDEIIAVAGNVRVSVGEKISYKLEKLIENRKTAFYNKADNVTFTSSYTHQEMMLLSPLINNGDTIGCIILTPDRQDLNESSLKLIETVSNFFIAVL